MYKRIPRPGLADYEGGAFVAKSAFGGFDYSTYSLYTKIGNEVTVTVRCKGNLDINSLPFRPSGKMNKQILCSIGNIDTHIIKYKAK